MALVVKNPPTNGGDIRELGSIPGLGRSPGGQHGNLLQYSCLENPMDRGAWWTTVHRVAKVGCKWGDLACTTSYKRQPWTTALTSSFFSALTYLWYLPFSVQIPARQVSGSWDKMRPVTKVWPCTFLGRWARKVVLREHRSSETRGSQSWEVSCSLACMDSPITSRTMEGEGCYQDGFVSRGPDGGKDKRYNRGSLTPSLWPPSL